MEWQCITNGAATQPHPTQPHRDGERPSPVQCLVMGIDGAQVRRGKRVWNTEMRRHYFGHPKVANAHAMYHLQPSAAEVSLFYRKVIADIDR